MSCLSILRIAACCLLTNLPLYAQPEAKSARHGRFLAVGDSPPFRQEIRDGVRYELDPPPDSIPPRVVVPGFGKEATAAVAMHLGRISAPVTVPAGEGILELRRRGESLDTEPWVRLKRPEAGDFLVFLWRTRPKGTWKNAASLVVPDGPDGAPAGTVRIVNLFPRAVRIMWGAENLLLPAGKSLQRAVKPGAEIRFQILVADPAATLKEYYSGSVTQNRGERGLVTIYQADGVAPRRPLKVSMLREPVAPAAPAPAVGKNR